MATAAPDAAAAAPAAGGGKKKLILILAIVLVVLIAGGVGAMLLLKKKAPVEGEDGEEGDAEQAQVEVAKPKPGTPPVYLPMDPFTVNLADADADRYAQIALTLEVVDQKTADLLKGYMPAVRSGVIVVLSRKSAAELLSPDGKARLQQEVLAEAVRPLGFEVEIEPPAGASAPDMPKKRKKKSSNLPVSAVLFAQFIVQ